MKKTFLTILTFGCICVSALAQAPLVWNEGNTNSPSAASWNTTFQLLKEEIDLRRSKPGNLCLSPLSLQVALAMVSEGAADRTLTEIEDLLPPTMSQTYFLLLNKSQTLTAANSIWMNNDFAKNVKKDFIQRNTRKYDAEVHNIKFNSVGVRSINDWCKKKTKGLISNIIDRLNREDKMVIANALHFKAEWEIPFEKSDTRKQPFSLLDGRNVNVQMMQKTDTWEYAEDMYCQAISLPYEVATDAATSEPLENTRYTMYILLPQEGLSLKDFINMQLNTEYWQSLDFESVSNIHLQLPRWKSDFSASLVEPLRRMGMRQAFTRDAQFPGITKSNSLLISNILQKTYINVNETGTEAAAATAAIMTMKCAAPTMDKPIEMNVNRPFVYILAEQTTDTPVFVGVVVDPR